MPLSEKKYFPTYGQMEELIKTVRGQNGYYDTTDYKAIVKAVRNGDINKIPIGAVFKVPHNAYGDIYFVVRARNQHKVAGDPTRSTLTVQSKFLLSSNGGSSVSTFQYDRQEAFHSVASVIPANSIVKFTTIAYGGWAAGTYHFTPTLDLPVGTKLCISGNQGTALTSLKVVAYASAKATSALGQFSILSGAGDATVDLGTWGNNNNHPQRVSYGSNNEPQSNLFQWLNGDSGSAYMDSIFVPKTEWDMMDTSFVSKKGFLGGFSEDFRSCLGLCAIPNITNSVFETGYSLSSAYSHNGYFFLPSRKELYGTNEIAAEAEETQFPYYASIGTTNADKQMYAKGASSPYYYWLRTPYASNASRVRNVNTDGSLNGGNASSSGGCSPACIIA